VGVNSDSGQTLIQPPDKENIMIVKNMLQNTKTLGGSTIKSLTDWTDSEVAAEHNNLNKQYFKDNIVDTLPYFFKLKEAVEFITSKNVQQLSCLDVVLLG
jgi:hypothetical protein